MTKKFYLYGLFLLISTSICGQTRHKIGDLIINPDGSKGIVFYINPEDTKGFMVALEDIPSAPYGKDTLISEIPQMKGNDTVAAHWQALSDMDGYTNTLYMKAYSDCDSAQIACSADLNNGWFIPSLGILMQLRINYPFIRQKLLEYGGMAVFVGRVYWSSTQYSANSAWAINSASMVESIGPRPKTLEASTRLVKEFTMPPKMQMVADTTLDYRWHTGDSAIKFFAKPATDSTFTVTATSNAGCASTASKQIFVASTGSATAQIFDTICVGYAYKQNGFDFPADSNQIAGTTTHTKTLSNGVCDVSVTLHLTKKKTDSTAIIDSFCAGGSYVHNGVIYQTEGDYVQFLTSQNQCDSVLYLKLSHKYPKFSEFSDTACDHYVWNNQYYYNSGIYSQTFAAANGCDSAVKKTITITKRSHGYLELDSCTKVTYKNNTFFKDTTFVDTLVNSAGCDSLLTVRLSIIKSDFDTVRFSDCDSVFYRGTYYFSSTTVDTLIKLATCGTLETAYLTVNRSYFNQQNLQGTDSLEYLSNMYYSDTTLIFSYQTINNCDSVENVYITIKKSSEPPPIKIETEIVVYWHRVLAVPNRKNLDELKYATYYWYKDGVLLPQSHNDWIEVGPPIPVGKYNVSIHYGGAEILYLERVFTQPFGVSAYPNPVHTSEELTIEAYGNNIKRVEIFDMNGVLQKLPIRTNVGDKTPVGALRATPLHIGFKKSGAYILKIYLDNQTIETVKIIVK